MIHRVCQLIAMDKFVEYDFGVYQPHPLNKDKESILIDVNNELKKIQTITSKTINNDKVIFKIAKNTYTDKVPTDYFALYDYHKDRLFLVKNNNYKNKIIMYYNYFDAEKNNSLFADDYDFDNIINAIL